MEVLRDGKLSPAPYQQTQHVDVKMVLLIIVF